MFGFAKKIDEELEIVRRLMDYYEDDFKRIEAEKPRGSLLLKQGKRTESVILQRELDSAGGERRRIRRIIGASDSKEALVFAREDYLARLNSILKNNEQILVRLQKRYLPYDLNSVLGSVSAASRAIIEQAGGYDFLYNQVPDRASFSKVPMAACSSGRRRFIDPNNSNIAASGRPVRSKGEVIIDILLDQYSIPHGHEIEIELVDENGFKVIRIPDFTLFCREKIYWEHQGMLDKDDYLFANAKKIQLYNRNGIVLWKNLIITTDGPGGTVDASAIEWIIKEFVLPRMKH